MSLLYRLQRVLFHHSRCQAGNQKSFLLSHYSPSSIRSAAREREQLCSSGGRLSLIVQVHITHSLGEGGEYWQLTLFHFNTGSANRTVHRVWKEQTKTLNIRWLLISAQKKNIQKTWMVLFQLLPGERYVSLQQVMISLLVCPLHTYNWNWN